MSETLTALASENLNPSLRSLLEDVQRGHIRVPRFQRPFIWKDEQRLQLLESVRDNMPIGSLLVWGTTQFELASFPMVGPHVIPNFSDGIGIRGRQYLLDGHQRVSTLLGVLLSPIESVQPDLLDFEDKIDWNIEYDLIDQNFVFVHRFKKSYANRPFLPLFALFDGRLVNRHMRMLREKIIEKNWSSDEFELWEERADQLSYRFQQYRIPIVVMATDDLDLAARTFQRINSQGTPMGEAHLVAALTWTSKFDLRERLATFRDSFSSGWKDLEDRLFLQVCKGLIANDISKVEEKQLIENIRKNSDLLDRAADGIYKAINLLESKAGVVRYEMLPYALQLVYLAIACASNSYEEKFDPPFLSWFWRTGWAEVFGSGSFRQMRMEQESLKKIIINQSSNEWSTHETLRTRFDSRYARVRVWMLRMAMLQGGYKDGEMVYTGYELLRRCGKDAFVKLVSTPKDSSLELKNLYQSLGNRCLIDPTQLAFFRRELQSGEVNQITLEKHLIDRESLKKFQNGDIEGFIRARNTLIEKWDYDQWHFESENW